MLGGLRIDLGGRENALGGAVISHERTGLAGFSGKANRLFLAIEMTKCRCYKAVMKIEPILADAGISISELKKNPSAVIAASDGFAVAILNRNRPAAYLVPALLWEEILDRLDDIELTKIVRKRWNEKSIPVDLADL